MFPYFVKFFLFFPDAKLPPVRGDGNSGSISVLALENICQGRREDKNSFISSRLKQLMQSTGSSHPFLAILIPKSMW
jgi:hypothetical protein